MLEMWVGLGVELEFGLWALDVGFEVCLGEEEDTVGGLWCWDWCGEVW
jgi:hypothetical protein